MDHSSPQLARSRSKGVACLAITTVAPPKRHSRKEVTASLVVAFSVATSSHKTLSKTLNNLHPAAFSATPNRLRTNKSRSPPVEASSAEDRRIKLSKTPSNQQVVAFSAGCSPTLLSSQPLVALFSEAALLNSQPPLALCSEVPPPRNLLVVYSATARRNSLHQTLSLVAA